MNPESKNTLTIDYAFIIAILTGLLYLLSFVFYAGEFQFYRIPLFLVELTVSNMIYSMIHLSPLVIMIIWATVITFRKPKDKKSKIRQVNNQVDGLSRKDKRKGKGKLRFILFLLFIFLSISLSIYFLNIGVLFGIISGIIIDIAIVISRLLYRKKNYVYLALVIYSMSCVISYLYGYTVAAEKKRYIIVEENNESFVSITVYKEQFVLSPFNKNTNEFSNEFKLVEMKDVKNFKQEKTGVIKYKN